MARFMQKPYLEHLKAVKQILRYVAGTKDLALKYDKLPSFVLSGFSDSDYDGDRDDRKSTSAYVFSIGSGAISWASKKQPTTALSTTEAEYHAMSITAQEAIWMRHLLKEIGYEQVNPSQISSAKQSAITLAKNPIFSHRTKHVEIQAHFIREKVLDGVLFLQYCPFIPNSANLFTKPFPEAQFCTLRDSLGLVKLPSRGSVS